MRIELPGLIGRSVIALMVFSVLPLGAFATPVEASIATEPGKRPRIGLVLSGGGAKGGAHVGVLKVLEELHVPVDCIAGTSMGALIGAGYASGQPAADLESFVNGIDWSQVVGGAGRRELQPIEQKRMEAAASTPMELGFQQGSIVTPGGLTNSSGIDNLLRTYVARSRMVADFDQLPIPFRAVATDMVSGKMVVMDHGDLATAMRASMAIAGAFSPVVQNGYVLSDGGMVRNIPVDIARDMCADMVIVVDLVESPTPPEKLVQATQLLKRSMGVMIKANEAVSLASLTERDILISVPMGDITTSDFDRVPETIPLGEAAARVVADRLAAYSVPEAEYTAWRQGVTTHQGVEARVASVQFEGLERVNPEYLRTMTTIQPGDTVSIDAISADALQMSALEDLDSVSYRIEGDLNNATLTWLPEEVSIGRDVLRPSLGMYGDGGGDLKFLLGVQHVRHWLNDRGAQWRNTFQLGSRTMLTTSLYQPFDVGQRYFVEPGLLASRSVEDVYIDGSNVATYRFDDLGGRIDLGSNLGRNAQLRFGYWNGQRRTNVQTGFEFLPESDFRDAGLAFSARYDSRDKAAFAKSGLVAAVEYQRSDDSLGADRNWDFVEAGLRKALPIRKDLMWISVAGGTDLGDKLPGDRAFSIGGPNTMPAYQYDELRVGSYWLVDASFLWHLKDLARVKNQAIYAGIGLQAGGFYDRVDLVADNEVYGVSAYLSGPTQIGTFKLGAAANSETWSVWLSLGRSVGNGSILDHGLFR